MIDRMLSQIDFGETDCSCWIWKGGKFSGGYGRTKFQGKTWTIHRLIYEIFAGPVLNESLDHTCKEKLCVNPMHLEPVSLRENIRRGGKDGIPNWVKAKAVQVQNRKAKTHCKQGHEYTPENTYLKKNGNRACRECGRIRLRKRKGAPND